MTLCDDCQKLCKDKPTDTIRTLECSEYEPPVTLCEVDYMIKKLLKFYHIDETDEQVKIVMQTLEKQAKILKVRDKMLNFLEQFKEKLP